MLFNKFPGREPFGEPWPDPMGGILKGDVTSGRASDSLGSSDDPQQIEGLGGPVEREGKKACSPGLTASDCRGTAWRGRTARRGSQPFCKLYFFRRWLIFRRFSALVNCQGDSVAEAQNFSEGATPVEPLLSQAAGLKGIPCQVSYQ